MTIQKFRAWLKEECRMIDVCEITFLVKYKIGWKTFTEEVAYDKNFAGFGVMDTYADAIFTFGKLAEVIDLNSLEVVGNIYENPELLG